MRFALVLMMAAALGGCERKASFDEAYESRTNELTAIANDIQRDLDRQLNAGALPAEAKALPPAGEARGP